jgi:hypothetical protein
VQQLKISYGLSYGAVSMRPIWHRRVGRFVNDENERIRTEATVVYHSGISVDRLTQETTSIHCQDTQCPGGDSYRITPEYKSGESPLQSTWSLHPSLISRAEKHLKVTQPSHLACCAKIHKRRTTTPHISATSRSITLNFDIGLKPQGNI